ncbi:MAG: hypothetical protein ACR2KQ_00050 [Actinomycetota bacterium]
MTPPYCTGCGAPRTECAGNCRRELDPPRFCPECGKRLFGQVTPTGYSARCKRHGTFDLDVLSPIGDENREEPRISG